MRGLQGIVPILLTPFHDDLSIDYVSLHREVEATLATGVHGIGIAIGSEVFKLTPKERSEIVFAVADQVKGKVPLIVNVSAPGTAPAVQLALEAAACGATRLMIWPPDFFPGSTDSVIDHLRSIGDAVNLPIVLQDVPQAPISPAMAVRIAEAVPLVDTIKVETQPTVSQVNTMATALGDQLSILGGAGGGTIVEEYRRGARGTMPFASQSLEFMQAWNFLCSGDFAQATKIVEDRILPASRLGFQSGDLFYHVHKAILQEAGLFQSAHVRPPTRMPDALTEEEIERLVARVRAWR